MQVIFLKEENIIFQNNEVTEIKKGDRVEADKINKVSPTLLNYYIKNGFIKMETKSSNPVMENKAIDPVEDNKSDKEIIEELKAELRSKKIKFHPRTGLEKLKQLKKNLNN
jgi:ribosomal protein L9